MHDLLSVNLVTTLPQRLLLSGDLNGAEMLAALLVVDVEALAGLGEEGGRAVAGCQGVASDVTGDASDLRVIPLVQAVVVLEGGLYHQSGDLCIKLLTNVTDKIL